MDQEQAAGAAEGLGTGRRHNSRTYDGDQPASDSQDKVGNSSMILDENQKKSLATGQGHPPSSP